MKKKVIPVLIVIGLIFIIGIVGVISFFINRYTPTDEMEDLEVYYGLTEERQAALIINDEISDIPGIWRNEEVYMSYEAVWKLLDTQFYWDDSSQKMLLTTPEGIRQIAAGDTGYTTENGAPVLIADEEGKPYLAVHFIMQVTDIECAEALISE